MPSKLAVKFGCLLIIGASLWIFISSGVQRGLEGLNPQAPDIDFYLWYTAGQLWNESRDPYEYDVFRERYRQLVEDKPIRGNAGYYYPPQTTVLFALLAQLPLRTAHLVLLGINLILLAVSMILLAFMLSWYRPLGLPEVALLASFTATGFGRMNIREGQTGVLLSVLVLGAFILAQHRRATLAGIMVGALTLKPSFFPLYFGYYLLRRAYRLLLACVAAAGLFTVLPLLVTGRPIVATLLAWLDSLRVQNASGIIDDPSPFTPNSALMAHFEPLGYRLLNAHTPLTTALVQLIVLMAIAATAYLLWRGRFSQRHELLDFGLVSALSLVAVYHRPYDGFLLFPGLLYLYIYALDAKSDVARRIWLVFVAGILLLLILPIDLSATLSARYPTLLESYVWRVIAPFQAWAGIAVLGALLWLKRGSIHGLSSKAD